MSDAPPTHAPLKLSGLSMPFGARTGLKSAGKPPTLAYSIIRTRLNEIVAYRMERRTEEYISRKLDVSRNTVRKVLDISLSVQAMTQIERAAGEDYEAKEQGREPKGDLWAPVEDYIFKDFPGFRETKFWESMMRDIKQGRLARRMGEKPGPKRKRGSKGETPSEAPKPAAPPPPEEAQVPAGFGTADNRKHAATFDELRNAL